MYSNFYELTNDKLDSLNANEQKIYSYVASNIKTVKKMTIRVLSENCFVSTTTIFRFIKKLGFPSYSEFIDILKLSDFNFPKAEIPEVFYRRAYNEEYIKNFMESIRVISQEQIDDFNRILDDMPTVFLFARRLNTAAAVYTKYVLESLGYVVVLPQHEYEFRACINQVKDGDLAFAISFSGNHPIIINTLQEMKIKKDINIVSITKAGNNILQNMSNVNFYMFADNAMYNNIDITSRISMIGIIETLFYNRFTRQIKK